MKLLIATTNQGKFNEISLKLEGLPLELLSLKDIQVDDSTFVEDGDTFEENARKKAKFYAQNSQLMTLADDSGLIVEALQGELGLKTRRWGAGEKASDQEWLDFFMKRMAHEKNRKAKFVSCTCLVDAQGNVLVQGKGEVSGVITLTIEAPIKPGIPLSSVFKPDHYSKVHSAMTTEEKARISHRGKSMVTIRKFLENFRCIVKDTNN